MAEIAASKDHGRRHPIATEIRGLIAIWTQERMLFGAGVVGLILGVAGLVVFAVYGRFIPPEGDLFKAISFNLAAGMYLLTIALLVPMASFSPRRGKQWRAWHAAMALGTLAIENVQVLRGQDPRFARMGSLVNNVLGCVFLAMGIAIIATFAAFTRRVLRNRGESDHERLLLLGVRYACVAALLAFASGLCTSVVKGLKLGEAPNLMPLHGLGFHALQAVPLTAYLLAKGTLPFESAQRWVHWTGASWLGACLAVGWQALRGQGVFEWGPANAATLFFLMAWAAAMMRAGIAWRNNCTRNSKAEATELEYGRRQRNR